MGAPDCFGDTAPVHWVGYSAHRLRPAPAYGEKQHDRACRWPRCFGWKSSPGTLSWSPSFLFLTLWPLLHLTGSGIPLKRKVRLLPLCSESDPESLQCVLLRPQHALFPPSRLHSLLTLSSLLTLLQSLRLPFCSLLLGHLCPGIYYLVHSWSSAGALLRFSVFNEASLTSAILQHLPTPPAGLSLILCHGFFIFIITRDTVSQEYQHKYNNDN